MHVIEYDRQLHEAMISGWWRTHCGTVFQCNMLPPVGVVAVDDQGPCAALWMHLSVNVGMACLENPVTRPGMTFAESQRALLHLMACLEEIAKTQDDGVMVVHTPAAIARVLEGHGFEFSDRPVFTGVKLLHAHGN